MSNGNLSEQTKGYIEEEIKNKIPSEDTCKVRFFKMLKEAPDNSIFVEKFTSELIKRVDFWEQLNKQQAKRIEQVIREHSEKCSYRNTHTEYHSKNESKWGLQLNIKNNVFVVIKYIVMFFVFLLILAIMPDRVHDYIRAILRFK